MVIGQDESRTANGGAAFCVASRLSQNDHLQFRKSRNLLEFGLIKSVQFVTMPFGNGSMEAVVDMLKTKVFAKRYGTLHFRYFVAYGRQSQKGS